MSVKKVTLREKRILLVSHEMTYTGAPRSLLKIAGILREEGGIVDIWTLCEGAFVKEFENMGFEVESVKFPSEASEKLAKKLRKFDFVIANTIFTSSFACYAQRYANTILYIREACNIPQLIVDCGLNESDLGEIRHVVCVSEYAGKFIEEKYHPPELNVIHNFVEDTYGRNDTKERKQDNNTIDVLVLGTIEPRKGQKIAIEAFLDLPDEIRARTKLHFAGGIPEWAKDYWVGIEKYLSDQIIYHGEIRKSEVLQELYQDMDIILVPSMDESCSLVALEAAMYGKPLLVTENVGAKYLVDSECIIKTHDSAALCVKLQELISCPQRLDELGKRNREQYLQHGTKEQYGNKLLGYLENLPKVQRRASPNVSVVVPTYNVEDYLEQCMDSIIAQTLENIEIICVNDGSTDKSLRILKNYQAKDARIQIITTENLGYGHAVNIGMSIAKGEYIGIVEPDDYIDERMYEVLYHRAIAVDADILKGDFYRFYGEGDKQENIYNSTAREQKNYNRVICPRKEKECFRFIMNTWSGIYRRSFLEHYAICHNETPGASYQDNGFWFQGFCQAERIYFINEALYYNRRDNPGSSVNNRKKVYCANKEYAWIRMFLAEHPELETEFIYQYSMKKYHTYVFTLERIAWEYKREYLERMAKEFQEAEQKGELSKAVFTPQEWECIHWMIRDTEEYYEKVVKGEIKISVIIPVYNAELYLIECLESLAKQYFRQIEVICIDDGSTDDSLKILENFARRDKRFQICSQKNAGAGAARNRGLAMARGEYVIFLDADDYFAPEMLMLAWQRIRETESDICVMGSWQHDMETENITPCTYSVQLEHYPAWRPFRVSEMQFNPFRCFVGWAWDKLYRRSFLLNHDLRFQEQRTSNDMFFTYMSLFKAGRITTLENRVIYQRRNVKNSLSATREKSWECFYNALIAMKLELQNMGILETYRVYLANYVLHSCLWKLNTLEAQFSVSLLKILMEPDVGWFQKFGVNDLTMNEFENKNELDQYIQLMEHGAIGLRANREKNRSGLKEQDVIVQIDNQQGARGKQRVRHMQDFEGEADYYRYCVDEIRKSKSYKIGLALTWLPRKIRGW